MSIKLRSRILGAATLVGLALSGALVPAQAGSSSAASAQASAKKKIRCSVSNVQYRVRRDFPNPYAQPGQDPYDGGIRNVLVVKVTGAAQRAPVVAKYLITGQSLHRTASNYRGKYVSVGYGAKQSMSVKVTTKISTGSYFSCGSRYVPRVKNLSKLTTVSESAFQNYWR